MEKTVSIHADKPVVIMSIEEYESIKETIEVLSDKNIMEQLKESEKARMRGEKPIDFEKLKSK